MIWKPGWLSIKVAGYRQLGYFRPFPSFFSRQCILISIELKYPFSTQTLIYTRSQMNKISSLQRAAWGLSALNSSVTAAFDTGLTPTASRCSVAPRSIHAKWLELKLKLPIYPDPEELPYELKLKLLIYPEKGPYELKLDLPIYPEELPYKF